MNAPDTLRAGDSVAWTETLPSYPATAGWQLHYRLLRQTGAAIAFAATAAGDDHAISLSRTDTASWPAGSATLVTYVERGSERVTLDSQPVTILPDLSVAATHDGRSKNRKALDDAEAALAAYLAGGKACVAEYQIDDKRMRFRDTEQILALIAHYKIEVARETAALALLQGGSTPGRVYYRAGRG